MNGSLVLNDCLIFSTGVCYFCILSAIPQIQKHSERKKADGVSNPLIICLIIGLSLWFIYGIIQEAIIKSANSVGIMLNFFHLTLKIKESEII